MDISRPAPHHLYVHVPFCRLVCAYCDFVTVGGRAADLPRYVDALLTELAARPAPGELRTIYFGGGTPSLLTGEQAERVIGAARGRWGHVAVDEVTVEANPSQRELPDWDGLRDAGATRISLGVQSLRDADLVALARGHTAREARWAFAAARAAGFDNVSVDLIYGIPGQSLQDWRDGLRMAIELGPDHVSCYALQLALAPDEWAAPPRPGALRWRNRVVQRQDDGLASEQYGLAEEVLGAAGYRHYELSSWARPGRESRHNSAYWARRAYTGIGAGAHSYDGAHERSWNERDLDGYLDAAEAGERPLADREVLDGETLAFEAIALGLRRIEGIGRRAYADEFGRDPVERFSDRISEGEASRLLEWDSEYLRLTPHGRLFASEACLAFLPEPVA
ncbi:MAG TPA: radical SAM family heme chaperone HemW [Candidatus Limnocylindrales bacterium]|nr:radical SAM family heme chaperone HemW [Candidatus Limnocylindrales bacterium]